MPEFVPLYGALPYYQIHFVISGNGRAFENQLIARTIKRSKGIIKKQVIDAWWEGGIIADKLNQDTNLRALLIEILLQEGDIYIDPTENGIRIYSDWKPEYKIKISKKALEAYNIIAGHVKNYLSELTVSTQ
ncbi:MAG: hypothetical protein ACE5J2_06085 [Nitrososphaerales archaeon]